MSDRTDLMLQYFDFLLNEYGFQLVRKEFAAGAMGNAVVTFKSATVGIEVVIDRNDVLITMGEPSDRRRDWFEFSDVVKYYAPQVEKVYDFPKKTSDNTWDDVVEAQLGRLSRILRQHCEPVLRGQPLAKLEIKRIEDARVSRTFGRFMRGSQGR